MKKMSRYCKAYPTESFRSYAGWRNGENDATGENVVTKDEQNYLFLHEDFVVTGDVFRDEQIVFDQVTDEWKDFCKTVLQFEVPADVAALDVTQS